MAKAEFDALMREAEDVVRSQGADPSMIERLRDHSVLYEVVGKWPPEIPVRVEPEKIESALHAVRRAAGHLTAIAPTAPVTHHLRTALARLEQSADAPPEGAPPDDEEGGAGQDAIVGPWPPG